MQHQKFNAGEIIFEQGAPSHRAYMVVEGEVEIVQESGSHALRLATLGQGEIFGEMGLVEESPRGATAKATQHTTVNSIDHNEFIALIKDRPDDCMKYLHSLFVRLRSMNARLVQHAEPEKPALTADAEIHCIIRPVGERAQALMPSEGFMVTSLPFRVGRKSQSPLVSNDLALEDQKPYHLSRNHFVIERKDGHVLLRDRGSFMGTQVNGLSIGGHAKEKIAFLQLGKNNITAGGPESPFQMSVEVIENRIPL